MERFAQDPLKDARIPFTRNTLEAAEAFIPFGAGMGSFVQVYGMFEKPEDALAGVFANRAHNDLAELWLETGRHGCHAHGALYDLADLAIIYGLAPSKSAHPENQSGSGKGRDDYHSSAHRPLACRLSASHKRHDGDYGFCMRYINRSRQNSSLR